MSQATESLFAENHEDFFNSIGQNAKFLLKLAFPLPPGADMLLNWLRSESCHKRL
jgi:hypothetical protein